jgi:hypothetical protein
VDGVRSARGASGSGMPARLMATETTTNIKEVPLEIPTSFKLDRRPYLVSVVRHTKPVGTMGSVLYCSRQIEIATHSGLNQREFTREELADTFWHEVTHTILHDMGNKLWRSEKFVTEFSRRLTEVVLTAKLPR